MRRRPQRDLPGARPERPHGLNRGDAQLAPLIGACLGWISISAFWTATIAWILLAGAFVLPAVLTHRISRRDALPLGPFMLLGALTAIALARL